MRYKVTIQQMMFHIYICFIAINPIINFKCKGQFMVVSLHLCLFLLQCRTGSWLGCGVFVGTCGEPHVLYCYSMLQYTKLACHETGVEETIKLGIDKIIKPSYLDRCGSSAVVVIAAVEREKHMKRLL